MNYIIAYRSGRDYFPISIFINNEDNNEGNNELNYRIMENLADTLMITDNPADKSIIITQTLLDYEGYLEDRENITTNLLKVLDETFN